MFIIVVYPQPLALQSKLSDLLPTGINSPNLSVRGKHVCDPL